MTKRSKWNLRVVFSNGRKFGWWSDHGYRTKKEAELNAAMLRAEPCISSVEVFKE